MDHLSPQRRSENMRRIRSTNTTPEIVVRRILHRAGFRFRLHSKNLPGCPDIVLMRHKIAVFVHGCFWHGHKCKDGRRPKSNRPYWNKKLDRNITRDRVSTSMLKRMDWKRIVIWACEVKNVVALETRLERLLKNCKRELKWQ